MIGLQIPVYSQFMVRQGVDCMTNLNQCWREAIEKGDPQWAWIMGDDHTFDGDILTRLLDHNVDAVAPFCTKRKPPFTPLIFLERTEDRYRYARWDEIPEKGLWQVAGTGSAGLLLSRGVMNALGDPWFTPGPQYGTSFLGWDLYLCDRIREKGFLMHVDLDLTMGHTSPVIYRPGVKDGSWGVNLDLGLDQILHLK